MKDLTICNTTISHDSSGRYCLNDLHRAAGGEQKHRPNYWLETQQTKDLAAEVEVAGIPAIVAKQGVGTFVVKELVYAYAMWISPAFHLHVIRAFDALVMGRVPHVKPVSMGLDKLRGAQALKLSIQNAEALCARFPNLSANAVQVIYAKLVNPAAGDEVLALPRVDERLRSATEVGGMFDVSANKIGRLANKHGIKTSEYGEIRLSKSQHNDKQVEQFFYNSHAVETFRKILSDDVTPDLTVVKEDEHDA